MRPLLLQFEESPPARFDAFSMETDRRSLEVMTENQRILAGTSTFTEIRSEAPDSDPDNQNRGGKAIPV